jgi:hypothetical protein
MPVRVSSAKERKGKRKGRKNSNGRTGNRTRDLMAGSQKF